MKMRNISISMAFVLLMVFGVFAPYAVASDMLLSEQKVGSPETVDGAKSINAQEAKSLFNQGVIFVDVRKDSDWEAGRIPGAEHLDLESNYSEEALLAVVSKDDPVVIYCNGIFCLRSSEAAKKAVKWGYQKIYYFREGYPSWKQSDYPVE